MIIKGPKPPRKPCGQAKAKKTANEDEDTPPADSKDVVLRIVWSDLCTDQLVEWLEENVEDRQRLFSDSAHDAKEEKRHRRTAKSVKTSFHIKMADYILSADEDIRVRDSVRALGAKVYAKAIENHIARQVVLLPLPFKCSF